MAEPQNGQGFGDMLYCCQAFNKLLIGSSPFPTLLGKVGQLIVSWYCVHGYTCMYVEERLTRTD